ncbi:MAG TPA: FecR family protein [Gammaproteobacteria bacterium]|nr:FecR family protein [Gammaproteobacteria bacterium]
MTESRGRDGEAPPAETAEEALVRTLIESAGRGPRAPDAARARVYAATRQVWRRKVADRQARQRRVAWIAAAAAVVAAVGALTLREGARPPEADVAASVPVAKVAKIEGSVYVVRDGTEHALTAEGGPGEAVRAGDALSTSAGGGVALAFGDGLSLRVGQNSLLVLESPSKAGVERGLVYLDAGKTAGSRAMPFELETPLGAVRHLGTQYEALVGDGTVTVRVREGSVAIVDGTARVVGEAGEQITLREHAQPRREAVATHGADWEWIEQLAAVAARDDYPAAELLRWIARETGRRLEYESADAESGAAATTLHGLAGLTPQEALEAVAGTTRLGYRLVDDRLLISVQ